MRATVLVTVGLVALFATVASAGPSLTLYTTDLGLVKESRRVTWHGGRDTLRLEGVSSRLDPTSLRVVPGTGRLARLAYRWDVSTGEALLERAVGQRVRLVSRNERVSEGTLLSAEGAWLVVRADDGALLTLAREAMQEVRLARPESGLSLRPAIEAVVNDAKAGAGDVQLQYLTGGLSWWAEHTLVRTGETTATWAAVVQVQNTTGRSYEDARVKLIAGDLSRVATSKGMSDDILTRATAMVEALPAPPLEQSFADYHLYTLPGTATLRDRESQTLVLLEPRAITVVPRYVYRGNEPGVRSMLEFVNSAKQGTGAPLPAGRVRCYAPDGDADLQLTGETNVAHTSVDEKVTLELGTAFDLVAKRKRVSERRVSDREREYAIEIRLRNRKSVDATIIVEEPTGGEVEVLKSTHPASRDEANLIRFTIDVKAGQEVVLGYTARQRW